MSTEEPRRQGQEPLEPASVVGPEAAPPAPVPAPCEHEERIRELEDRLKRAQAEFVNETRRIQRQADERGRFAVEGLVSDLLPVLDALHSAREGFALRAAAPGAEGPSGTRAAALEGFEIVERELLNVLGRHGVQRIEAVEGLPFDLARHHAVVLIDRPDLPPGAVARELRPGFLLGERVVRAAHVAVVAAREPEAGPHAPTPPPATDAPTGDHEDE